jgi:hypothetical protein
MFYVVAFKIVLLQLQAPCPTVIPLLEEFAEALCFELGKYGL